MKNKFATTLILPILLIAGLGCGITERVQKAITGSPDNTSAAKPEDKTLSDKAVDTAVGDEKIGVPECDELFDSIADESKSPDDNYVTKATRQYFLNKIRESIKRSLEENKNDPAQMGKECKNYKAQLDKYRAEEQNAK